MLNEYVIVDCVADTAANHTNSQSKGRDCAYKVLYKLSDKHFGDSSQSVGSNILEL